LEIPLKTQHPTTCVERQASAHEGVSHRGGSVLILGKRKKVRW